MRKELIGGEGGEYLNDVSDEDSDDADDEGEGNQNDFTHDINLPENPIDEHFFDSEIFNEQYYKDLLSNVRKEFNCSYGELIYWNFMCSSWITISCH